MNTITNADLQKKFGIPITFKYNQTPLLNTLYSNVSYAIPYLFDTVNNTIPIDDVSKYVNSFYSNYTNVYNTLNDRLNTLTNMLLSGKTPEGKTLLAPGYSAVANTIGRLYSAIPSLTSSTGNVLTSLLSEPSTSYLKQAQGSIYEATAKKLPFEALPNIVSTMDYFYNKSSNSLRKDITKRLLELLFNQEDIDSLF